MPPRAPYIWLRSHGVDGLVVTKVTSRAHFHDLFPHASEEEQVSVAFYFMQGVVAAVDVIAPLPLAGNEEDEAPK